MKKIIEISVLEQGNLKTSMDWIVKELFTPLKLINYKAELYHATSPLLAKHALIMRKKPLVTTIHDTTPFLFKNTIPFSSYYQLNTLLAKKSDKIITDSHSSKKDIISQLGISPNKIKVVHLGIDHSFFNPLSENIKEGHNEECQKKVLFIGNLRESKGVDILINAFSIVANQLDNVDLLLGGRETSYKYRKLVHILNLEKKVKFLGFIPDKELTKYYRCADVFVFPTRYEGFGFPVLEAMACGTPVITSEISSLPEIVENSGILIKQGLGEEERYANAIIEILTNKEKRNKLRNMAIRRASLFTWKKTVEKTINVYNEVLGYSHTYRS